MAILPKVFLELFSSGWVSLFNFNMLGFGSPYYILFDCYLLEAWGKVYLEARGGGEEVGVEGG